MIRHGICIDLFANDVFWRLVKYVLAAKSNWNILPPWKSVSRDLRDRENTKAGVFPSEDVGMGSTTDTWRSGTKKCFQLDFVSKQIHGFLTWTPCSCFLEAEVIKDVMNCIILVYSNHTFDSDVECSTEIKKESRGILVPLAIPGSVPPQEHGWQSLLPRDTVERPVQKTQNPLRFQQEFVWLSTLSS